METAGARIEAADLAPLMGHPSTIGLAEFMNYPGVIHRDPGLMAKLRLFAGRPIDGHAPLLSGRDLNAYVAAGHPHRARGDDGRRGAREAGQGDAGADPRRLGVKGSGRAATGPDRAHGALHVPVHRRPQSARHRRAGASRPHDPHADRARHPVLAAYRAAACRRPRRSGCGSGSDRAGASGPISSRSTASRTAAPGLSSGRGAAWCRCAGLCGAPARSRRSGALGRLRPLVAADFRHPRTRGPTDVIGIHRGQDHHRASGRDDPDRGWRQAPDTGRDLLRIAVIERHGRTATSPPDSSAVSG
jgi:adenine deaminase